MLHLHYFLELGKNKKPQDPKEGRHHFQMAPIINVSTSEIWMLV